VSNVANQKSLDVSHQRWNNNTNKKKEKKEKEIN